MLGGWDALEHVPDIKASVIMERFQQSLSTSRVFAVRINTVIQFFYSRNEKKVREEKIQYAFFDPKYCDYFPGSYARPRRTHRHRAGFQNNRDRLLDRKAGQPRQRSPEKPEDSERMYKTSRPQEWRSKKSSDRSAREERLCARTTVVLPQTFLKTYLLSLTIRRHFKNRPLLRLAPRHKKRPKSTPFVWSRARRAARVTVRVGASRPFFFSKSLRIVIYRTTLLCVRIIIV